MAEINNGGPAFPCEVQHDLAINHHQVGNYTWQQYGISVRDYFAAKAMQGMLSNPSIASDGSDFTANYVTERAYVAADAMLRARGAA